MIDKIENALVEVRTQKPLILCLTNFVTVEFVANSLLALGAAPIMSRCEEEYEEFIKMAAAVYINLGTLDRQFILVAQKALEYAQKFDKPIIFDPVGAGASKIRTKTAQSLLPFAAITRGNISEIAALGDQTQRSYGVEAAPMAKTDKAEKIATDLARENKAVLMFSGPVDFITNGHKAAKVPFGAKLMQRVTGMGCAMTAIIAAFRAVIQDSFTAGNMAAHYFALCGEITAKTHQAPGTFKTAFLDQLYRPDLPIMRNLYERHHKIGEQL